MARLLLRSALCALPSGLLLLAMPMFGETVVTLERDGVPVTEGEVCRFRAGDAENPFRRWLTSDDVNCVAAGTPIQFPAGLWNIFGRVEGKALSAPVLIEGVAAPVTLSLKLEAAATLVPSLPAGQGGLVVAPRRNSAVPIAAGTQRVTVPAGEELWLLTVEKPRSITAVAPIAALAPGSERAVDARLGALPSSVMGWVQLSEEDRAALNQARDLSSPHVRLIAAGPALDSDPLPPPTSLNGAFVLVRGVSAGERELRLEGHGWLPHARRVKIADRVVTVVEEPLLARGAVSLLVSWSSGDDLVALDRSLGSCNDAPEGMQVEVTVSACARPEHPGESVDPASCKAIREETFVPQIPYGSFTVDDIVPGHYRAEMRFGKLPPDSTIVEAEPFQRQRVVVSAYYNTVYGSLTHGGEPLGKDATLAFEGGGVGFGSEETGEYNAVILAPPGGDLEDDLKIDIVTCDEHLRTLVLTDRPLRRNTRYDIDIPDNSLTVNVTDTFTRMPLRAATLHYVVLSSGYPQRPVVTRELKSEGESEFVLKAVPERQIMLRVRHAGYQEYRVKPFTMGKSEKKTIDVQLVPLRGSSGRIISSTPFENGMVLWLSPVGIETEHADLEPDGTFIHASSHTSDETMAVVSTSHPLWVMRLPLMGRRETLTMRFPDGVPTRAFDVTLKGPDRHVSTFIGLVIGGILVPQAALRAHQTLRELPTDARINRRMQIRDIAETGPIDVLLGPTVNEVSSRGRSFDPLLIPQSGEPQRQRLAPGVTEIVFDVK